MRVPIDWLKELISFRAGSDQLADMLTGGGLETVVLPEDILEIDILPNRADAWSIRGIAREVSALTKFKLKPQKLKVSEAGKQIKGMVKVEVRDKELCPRYLARVIENVKVGDSPEWLKKRLESVGLRSINNVVDVTNYLLHELGQPLHAFDAKRILEQTIIVRRANPGEKILTLDNKEYQLESDMLVIADPDKAIALAGIMGAANTEVTNNSHTIILESAFFNPVSIHKTAKSLKLRTESSIRFEHGVDWLAVEEALDRGASLIAQLSRGEVIKGRIEVVGKQPKAKILELRIERVQKLLGAEIPVSDMVSILKSLGFKVEKVDSKKLKVVVPSFRLMDIEREIDLIEEIARIWGYNRLENSLPNTGFINKIFSREDDLRQKVRSVLVGCGLNEVQSLTMLGPKDFERFGLAPERAIKITNPLTIEGSLLRSQLLPGLLNIAVYNQNRQIEDVFIFEIGKVFRDKEEKWLLAGLLMGSNQQRRIEKSAADYYQIKGIVENLFSILGLENLNHSESEQPFLQPGKRAKIEEFGGYGALHPNILRNYELTKPVYVFEFDLEAIIAKVPVGKRVLQLAKYPYISRDISMFIPAEVSHQNIKEVITQVGGELLENVFIFDQFKDSSAYRLIYRRFDRTLTEEEVKIKHQEIIQALIDKLAVRIR